MTEKLVPNIKKDMIALPVIKSIILMHYDIKGMKRQIVMIFNQVALMRLITNAFAFLFSLYVGRMIVS